MTTPAGQRLHLLEVDLAWPPETFLQWKLEALAAAGFRVTVAGRPNGAVSFRLDGVRLERLPPWDEPVARGALRMVQNAAALAVTGRDRIHPLLDGVRNPPVPPRRTGWRASLRSLPSRVQLSRLRPDVVHFEWESAAVHWLPVFDAWNCPVVVSCHGGGVNVHPHTGGHEHVVRAYRTLFRRAAAVHVVSEAIAKEAEAFGVTPERTWLIRPAVDPDVFRPGRAERQDSAFRVVAIGELIWRKGYDYALHAVRAVLDEGVPVRFDILGGEPPAGGAMPSDRPRILYTIRDLGLEECVRLHGDVSSSEVRRYLRSADLLLHASVSEGIPVAVLEAMACGVPVVVTDAGGTREAVRDGVEGLVVPPRDPRALARAMTALWHDGEARERMGRAGVERVRSAFSLGEQTRRFVELYETVAAARGEARR